MHPGVVPLSLVDTCSEALLPAQAVAHAEEDPGGPASGGAVPPPELELPLDFPTTYVGDLTSTFPDTFLEPTQIDLGPPAAVCPTQVDTLAPFYAAQGLTRPGSPGDQKPGAPAADPGSWEGADAEVVPPSTQGDAEEGVVTGTQGTGNRRDGSDGTVSGEDGVHVTPADQGTSLPLALKDVLGADDDDSVWLPHGAPTQVARSLATLMFHF